MKTSAVLLALVFFAGSSLAQVLPILTDQLIEPDRKQSQKNYITYAVGNYRVNLIDDKNLEEFYIVSKKTGKHIYDYVESEARAMHLKPRFFMTEGNNDLLIICMSLETTYSWGTHIFIVEDDRVAYPGFIPYGADNYNFSALGLYSQFEQQPDNSFIMFFQEDVKLINYETDDLLTGSEVEFKITRDSITRLQK